MPATQLGVSGIINANGTVAWSTENFSVEKTATGTYKITYSPEFNVSASPSATPIGSSSAVRIDSPTKSGCTVKFSLLATLLLGDTAFSFSATE